MALVTITYNAWDHNRQVIPAELQPRVGFRPLATSLANGMLTKREVWGSLNPTTGAGSVQLESAPGLLYVPFMEWLRDPSQASESVQNRALGSCEWEAIFPGTGGPITELSKFVGQLGLLYGFGNPPQQLENAIYLDITGPRIRIHGSRNAYVGS